MYLTINKCLTSRIPSCFDKDEDVKSIMDNPSFVEACNIFEESLPVDSCDPEKLTSLLEDFNVEVSHKFHGLYLFAENAVYFI